MSLLILTKVIHVCLMVNLDLSSLLGQDGWMLAPFCLVVLFSPVFASLCTLTSS